VPDVVERDDRGERPERLAILDRRVQMVDDPRDERGREDRA
jgi:hypothetical protein